MDGIFKDIEEFILVWLIIFPILYFGVLTLLVWLFPPYSVWRGVLVASIWNLILAIGYITFSIGGAEMPNFTIGFVLVPTLFSLFIGALLGETFKRKHE